MTFPNYRAEVERSIHIDTYFLLERYARRASILEDVQNINLVLSGIGKIREAQCAESLLLDFQI
jgi:hypothetical protein